MLARPVAPALLALLLGGLPATAETLQCRMVNGNVTCAGSSGASCQTVNGRTTCVSGGGGIVQQFGGQPGRLPQLDLGRMPPELRRLLPGQGTRQPSSLEADMDPDLD